MHPDSVTWESLFADGTKGALIEGSREDPSRPFTYGFFIPAGVWDGPHSHTNDARIFVAQGQLKIGFGAHMDQTRVETVRIGSFLHVPAGVVHYDGADVDTVIFGVTAAPFETRYVEGEDDDRSRLSAQREG